MHGAKWDSADAIEPCFLATLACLQTSHEQQKHIRRGIFDGRFDLDEYISAVRTPGSKKNKGRKGAREVRKIEQECEEGDKMTSAAATQYRAVAARCNYLAQDRPDIAYASKELYRDFAVPAIHSIAKLKHVGRHLVCVPR